jgi:hypothetical protein
LSIQVLAPILRDRTYDGKKKLILLAIADMVDSDGVGFASHRQIQRVTDVSTTYITACIREFVADGRLEIIQKGTGPGRATVYRVALQWQHELSNSVGGSADVEPSNSVAENYPTSTQNYPTPPSNPPSSTSVPETSVLVPSPDGSDPNAGQIMKAFLDEQRTRPPDRVVGHLARETRLLVEEGFPAQVVLEALRSIGSKGLHPSTLASEVNALVNGKPAHGGTGLYVDVAQGRS